VPPVYWIIVPAGLALLLLHCAPALALALWPSAVVVRHGLMGGVLWWGGELLFRGWVRHPTLEYGGYLWLREVFAPDPVPARPGPSAGVSAVRSDS
jgi:hypothetical protein